MTTLYFRNTHTNKRFKVVSIDREAGTITLRGDNAIFTEKYDKEQFKKLGYTLEKEEANG